MRNLSFKDAAVKILEEAGTPLSADQITNIAIENEWINTSGKTPQATMAAILYTDSGKFKKVGKNQFILKETKELITTPLLAIENQNQTVRKKLKEKLLEMDPFLFEQLVGELLTRIGYENVEVTQKSGDKGIDVTADLTAGGLTNIHTAIQVKRYKEGNNISGRVVTQLRGSAAVGQRGLIITTSKFTKDAISEAKATNKTPIALIDGEKLLDLMIQHKVGVKDEIVSVLSIDNDFFEEQFQQPSLYSSSQNKALWILPGGMDDFQNSLIRILDFISSNNPSKEEFIKWIISSFNNISSHKTANTHILNLSNIGLIQIRKNKIEISDSGKKYRATKSSEVLFNIIGENILAFSQIVDFLKSAKSPQTETEIWKFITDNFDVDWGTKTQVSFRLSWLIALQKIKKENGYYLAVH